MLKKIIYLSKILLLSVFLSCNSSTENTTTYFGGKIINPRTNHVTLYSMEKVIDTFYLDKSDKFIGTLQNINEGLYYFVHGNESQHIYLQPKDSLILRLNSWSFDESLVFIGNGAERNNILIDFYLENEREHQLFYENNKLNPTKFKTKVDSILESKKVIYDEYLESHPNETNGFKEILKIALTYPTFARIEKYPIIYAKYSADKKGPALEKSFYNYRKSISVNNDSLVYYPPYSQYLRNFLYNETYSLGHKTIENEYSPEFTFDLLQTINKNISQTETKNAFLKQTVISHFYNKTNCNLDLKAFDAFLKLSTNENDKTHIKQLISDSKLLNENENLPDFGITDFTNATHKISDVTKDKSSLLFFWNSEYVSEAYIVSRINYLSNKYPNVMFIQINLGDDNVHNIKNLDIKNQFYLQNNSEAHQFLTSKMPRSIIVDKKGKIVNGYASMFSNNLNAHLKDLK